MGIYCEISLFKPPNQVYFPGQVVAGVIKYVINEPLELQNITTSLKGHGCIYLKDFPGTKHESRYESVEEFVDKDTIVLNQRSMVYPGAYEIRFSYTLPEEIPSTMYFYKRFDIYRVLCFIRFYIRVKFEKPGTFVLNKHFRKDIQVVSGVHSRLSSEPVIYGESKKLFHLFSIKDSIVNIKATISKSTLLFGEKIELNYEVKNKSHVTIKSITTKLVQAYIFKAQGYRKVNHEEDVPGTETKTTAISCKDTQNLTLVIQVPSNMYNIESNGIVYRHYLVRIIAELPTPHKNVTLDIPVQIGVFREVEESECVDYNDTPPEYWEAMGETKNDYEYEECDDNKD